MLVSGVVDDKFGACCHGEFCVAQHWTPEKKEIIVCVCAAGKETRTGWSASAVVVVKGEYEACLVLMG
jgi:hypothetical protein